MLHAILAFDDAVDGEQPRFAEHAPLALRATSRQTIALTVPVSSSRRDEGDAAGGGRLLAHRDQAGDTDLAAVPGVPALACGLRQRLRAQSRAQQSSPDAARGVWPVVA